MQQVNFNLNHYHHVRVHVRNPNDGEQFTHTVLLNKDPETVQFFWQFWRIFKHGMLYLEGEEEPFTDMNCPAAEFHNKKFVFRPWTPNYAHLREEVNALPMDHLHMSQYVPV